MCGIAGLFKRTDFINEYEKEQLDGMLSRIFHRGPDDTGVCGICDKVFEQKDRAVNIGNTVKAILGFNRLSIQDLSQAGHQPMLSEDKRAVITYNGEIYNIDELKEELRKDGYSMPFRGHSDTEIILRCYSLYGIDKTLQMLNGMFAFVIADFREKKLYIVRDRIGIIPCHIMIDNNKIVWASEIKAFLALNDFNREVSNDALSDSFKFCYPNSSMYKNVENVEPGTYITYDWDTDTIRKVCYFSLANYNSHKRRISLDECEEVLKDCLSRQLISDAPLGVQLSGGIDSTLLAKYTSDIYSYSGKYLCGFSLVNENYKQYSEENWIDHVADQLQIDVHKFNFDDDTFVTYFEKALYSFERFVSIPSPIGIYKFSKEARKHVTVLISGEGADELAGGYGSFLSAKRYSLYEKIMRQKAVGKYGKYYPQTSNMEFISNFDSMLNEEQCRQIYPSFNIEKTMYTRKDYIESLRGSSFEKMRLMYFKEELVSLLERQNKVCMANSVENRVPFLDNRFIDLLFSIDEDQLVHSTLTKAFLSRGKTNVFEGKYILKQISANIYGEEFAYRNKQALRAPLSLYINNPRFKNYLNELIIPGMRKRGMVNMREFEKAYSNSNDNLAFLMAWKAINMEVWMQLFYDGREVVEL